MVSPSDHKRVVDSVRASPSHGRELRDVAMRAVSELPDYSWSGVYVLEGDTLVLDAFVGEPTDHTRIPVGRGVCGTAVAEERNQVIEDVTKLDNYLSCSIKTKAEIVVLIRAGDGTILGQIDIDGHRARCFDSSDEAVLEDLARVLAERWASPND